MNTDVWKILKIYKSGGGCDYQQQCKYILDSVMVSTPEGITYNSTISVGALGTKNKPIESNSLSQFLVLLDVKPRTTVRIMEDAKKPQGNTDRQCFMV